METNREELKPVILYEITARTMPKSDIKVLDELMSYSLNWFKELLERKKKERDEKCHK